MLLANKYTKPNEANSLIAGDHVVLYITSLQSSNK